MDVEDASPISDIVAKRLTSKSACFEARAKRGILSSMGARCVLGRVLCAYRSRCKNAVCSIYVQSRELVTAVAILSTSSGLREVLNLGVRLWVGNGMPGWTWLQGAEGLIYTQRCFRGPGVVAEVMEIAR
jgi:hypothetical protein